MLYLLAGPVAIVCVTLDNKGDAAGTVCLVSYWFELAALGRFFYGAVDVSEGMFAARALSTAARKFGAERSPFALRASTAIKRTSLEKSADFFASLVPFLCLSFAHLLCPAIQLIYNKRLTTYNSR